MSKTTAVRLAKTLGIWVPSILLGLLFVMQGVMKLQGLPGWIERFEEWGYPSGFVLVVGLAELICGIGLLVPRTAPYCALGLAGVMLGACTTHLLHGETANAGFTFILMLVFVLLAYARSPGWRNWRVASSA